MGGSTEEPRVRLQVTVDRNIAERIGELAARMGRSQSWLTAALLAETLNEREKVVEWAVWRLGMAFMTPIKGHISPSGETITIQTFVTPDTAARIEKMAVGMNQSVSKAGAWLLENAVEDHGWIIAFVTSSAGRKVMQSLVAVIDGWKKQKASASTLPE